MKTQSLLLALAVAPAALAHTAFTNFYVNGVSQGDGVAMRMRNDASVAGSPLEDLTSKDLACNVDGTTGVSRVQSVTDGATLSFEIRSSPNDASSEPIDRGHYGPCAVYLKKVTSAIDDKGAGEGWFKLWDDGYTASDKRWCTDRVIDNDGLLSVVLPKGLQGGYYLARPEILALHAANSGNPQFYAGCAQIFLESTGDLVPAETVAIPGYVKAGDPSVSVNIYYGDDLSKYTPPGPAVAKLESGATATSKSQTTQSEGLRPAGCIVENDNWCGFEVPSYSDEAGCWAAGKKCWDQAEVCYDTALPTGHDGCTLWQDKCDGIQSQCKSKSFPGPPNKGKDLTPPKKSIDVGLVMATQGGVVVDSPKTSAVPVKSSAPVSVQGASAATSAEKPKATYAEAEYTPIEEDEAAIVPADDATPKTTIAVIASDNAPAPTAKPCPAGWECIYKTNILTKTEYQYVTVGA